MGLRNKFGICIDALVREDGTTLWWPSSDEVVHQGDQALMLCGFAEEHRQTPIITMHMDKVNGLQHDCSFREQFGLFDGQASDASVGAQEDEKDSPRSVGRHSCQKMTDERLQKQACRQTRARATGRRRT